MDRKIIHNYSGPDPKMLNLEETLFHNANGYIGARGNLEEGLPKGFPTMRGMYLNGVCEQIDMKQAESLCNLIEEKQTMINVCDTQSIHLRIRGKEKSSWEEFSLFEGQVLSGTRVLDMDGGFTIRKVTWRSPSGKEVQIIIRRMASFEMLPLFVHQYSVRPLNFDGQAEFVSLHCPVVSNFSDSSDPRLPAESHFYLKPVRTEAGKEGGRGYSECRTERTKISVSICTAHTFSGESLEDADGLGDGNASPAGKNTAPVMEEIEEKDNHIEYRACVDLTDGQPVTMTKYTVFSDSVRSDDPEQSAKGDLETALGKGADYYFAKQREYLQKIWKSAGISIGGDQELNDSLTFNLYELIQSAARDPHCSIAAKGLSGEGYEGHYFWDTEMFMLPFYELTAPRLARNILAFRYQTLDKARENARLLGHRSGALYPWRTITGEECSGFFPSGTAAYHINGDIAYGVVSYYLTCGDTDFFVRQGAEILIETARLWLDTGNWYNGSFQIHEVTGPDEYTCMVDNNYYTNRIAQYNLKWAVKAAKLLKKLAMQESEGQAQAGSEKLGQAAGEILKRLAVTDAELEEMQKASDGMLIPYDEKLGINPQDDSFLSKPVWDIASTPKEDFPLLMHYHPLHLYRYQVCKQADTVMAYSLFGHAESREVMKRSLAYYEKITTHDSSLSTCIFSIVAARLGETEKAFGYFGNSANMDRENLHGNTQDGIHTANMGGCYLAVVHGFAGLEVDEQGLSLDPVVPEEWTGYRFSFLYRGNLLELEADKKQACVRLLEGESCSLTFSGKQVTLSGQQPEYIR